MKRLIKALDNARGNGTSMISLIMPPKSQVGGVLPVSGWLAVVQLLAVHAFQACQHDRAAQVGGRIDLRGRAKPRCAELHD